MTDGLLAKSPYIRVASKTEATLAADLYVVSVPARAVVDVATQIGSAKRPAAVSNGSARRRSPQPDIA